MLVGYTPNLSPKNVVIDYQILKMKSTKNLGLFLS